MIENQVYVVLKTNREEISFPTRDGETLRREVSVFGPDTVVGVFDQKNHAESEAEACGEYKYAADMEIGHPVPEVIIYTSDYGSGCGDH